ncbi:MAG: DUF6249 domain-containing protein [Rikenellaceae bacterium]|jgi:hypothetical protein|nr:hypothetical protein [Bacteroidales bacterium]
MLDFITVPLVTGICIFGFYKLVELFVRKRERIMLIERISQLENIDSNKIDLSRIFGKEPYRNGRFVALRAGMLLIGVGLGLLVGFIIVYNTFGPFVGDFYYRSNGMAELIYGSTTLLFGGLGLLAAFIIEHKLRKG